MPLVCLGLSHHTAPVEARERHAFPTSKMAEALIALCDYEAVREAVMLSTCGRLEIYAELDDYERGVEQLKSFLRNHRHAEVGELAPYLYTLLGDEAIAHLFRVSTGLDSMLIGEAEILGQVKDAYVQAQRAGSLGTSLHALFRQAISAGKAARSQTTIGDESVSVATAAIDLAKQHLGNLPGRSMLVVGAGKMGATAARRLKAEGVTDLAVANRSIGKARDIVGRLGLGRALEMPGIVDAIAGADIVITSTGAAEFVLAVEDVAAAISRRPSRPLFVIDIAVPRDCDPAVAHIPGVWLADIDGLRGVVDGTLERRRAAVGAVEEIIAEYAERFAQWYHSRGAVPVIRGLVEKAEAIRETEIARLFSRCPELTDRERMLITGASLKVVSRLLHTAVTKIRERAVENEAEALVHAQIVDELFDLRIRYETPPVG